MSVIIAISLMLILSLLIGLALQYIGEKNAHDTDPLLTEVVNILPQTQCAQCGYPGCRPYAEAIINNDEAINRCPPGGQETIDKLAHLLGQESLPPDETRGEHKAPQLAVIDESACIGCVKCIKACPVDAIIGSSKQMHTVINELCTGCELCIEPCPVDCISMIDVKADISNWHWTDVARGQHV